MGESLKSKVVWAMCWNGVQQFGATLIAFGANLFLARLLSPDDFGCLGILLVFIAISNIIVDGGLGAALIQKENPTDEDYCSVFYWNLVISIFLYIILFLFSPDIARFYAISSLDVLLRVLGVILIINAFAVIPTNQFVKQLSFKKLAIINIIASFVGAGCGIYSAYRGWGVWSLVIQLLVNNSVRSFLLWKLNPWKLRFIFDKNSFRSLYKFGGLILLSNIIETIYVNIQSLIIGKCFSVKTLGYYTQAKKLEDVPVTTLNKIIEQVTFPVFSLFQNRLPELKENVKKNVKAITFLNFPLMVLLIVIAPSLFRFLFTEKWLFSVPYFRILCFEAMLYTLNTANTNVFKAMGKGYIYFKVQFLKRIVGLITIVIGLWFGIWGMMWAIALNSHIYFFVNAWVSGRLFHYGIREQLKDVWANYLLAFVVGGMTCCLTMVIKPEHFLSQLILEVIFFTLIYLFLAYWFKLEGLVIYLRIFYYSLNKKRN